MQTFHIRNVVSRVHMEGVNLLWKGLGLPLCMLPNGGQASIASFLLKCLVYSNYDLEWLPSFLSVWIKLDAQEVLFTGLSTTVSIFPAKSKLPFEDQSPLVLKLSVPVCS